MPIYKVPSPKPGLTFLFPPVLTERRENAVAEPPTAMGIRQLNTGSVGSP